MIEISFSVGSSVKSVTASIGYETFWYASAVNSFSLQTPSGGQFTSYGGVAKIVGNLELKNLSYTDFTELQTFFVTYVRFNENSFTISALTNTDLGGGKNTEITNVWLGSDATLEGIFIFNPPGIYGANIPYWFKL